MMHRAWRVIGFVIVLACLLLQAGAGEAAGKKPTPVKTPASPSMTFVVVRSSVAGCEPNCPEWIAAEGQITAASGGQFRSFLKKLGKLRLPVVLTSQGGDVESALAIGRTIRERKLDVAVGWTLYTDCSPTVKTCKLPTSQQGVYRGTAATNLGYCYSACPFILAAGARRLAGNGSYVGLHEITTQPYTKHVRYYETYRIVNGKKKILSRKIISSKLVYGKVTTKLTKPFDRKLRTYVQDMGINLAMLELLHLAPPSSIHNLTYNEMKSTNLVTEFMPANMLTENRLCSSATPADNCKIEKAFIAAVAKVPAPPAQVQAQRQWSTQGSAMTFAVVRSNVAGCEPLCPQWIYADGIIAPDTPSQFKKVFAKAGNRRLPVIIRSDGGDAVAAMALGRTIRGHKLDVVVGATLFTDCSTSRFYCKSKPDAKGRFYGVVDNGNEYCNAACTLVLAAGQKRLAAHGDKVGVHKLTVEQKVSSGAVLKASTTSKAEDSFSPDLNAYLDDMGISRALTAFMDRAESAKLYELLFDQLSRIRLVTDLLPISSLTDNAVCKTSPPADNCVMR